MTNKKFFKLHSFCDCCDTLRYCKNMIPEKNRRFIAWDKDMKKNHPYSMHSRVDIIYQKEFLYLIEFKNWNWLKKDNYTYQQFQHDLYEKFNCSIDDFENFTGKTYSNVISFFAFNKEVTRYLIEKGIHITEDEFTRIMPFIIESMEPVRGNVIRFYNCKDVFRVLV